MQDASPDTGSSLLALLRVALTMGRRMAKLVALLWRDLTTDGARVTLTV